MLPDVRGIRVDAQTRCAHYNTPLDVIAIKMRCCRTYFACKDCHDALADHPLEPWSREEEAQRAVLCGVCRSELTISEYLTSPERCPQCGVGFNPGCHEHHGYYFLGA
jgi:uncharacterized CHY-type Zn-finger protein